MNVFFLLKFNQGKELSVGDYYNIFFKIRDTFNNVTEEYYKEYLYKGDQFLLNIALYLLENYNGDYKYFCDIDKERKERCDYLNRWLNEKKALYTSNTKCKSHNDLWDRYIERLWDRMQEGAEENKRCQRNVSDKKTFQDIWIIPSCNSSNSVEIEKSCQHAEPPFVPTAPALASHPQDHACPSSVAPITSSCKAVLTTTYVVFGILLFFMYFLRV